MDLNYAVFEAVTQQPNMNAVHQFLSYGLPLGAAIFVFADLTNGDASALRAAFPMLKEKAIEGYRSIFDH